MIDVNNSCPGHNSKLGSDAKTSHVGFQVLITETFFRRIPNPLEILFTNFFCLSSLTGVLISTASFPVLKSNRIFDGGAAGIEITNSAGESLLLD